MNNSKKIFALGSKDFSFSFLTYGIDAVLIIYLVKIIGNSEYSALQSLSVKSCIIYSLPILTSSISNKFLSNELLSSIGLMLMGAGLILLDNNNTVKVTLSLSLVTVGYSIGRPMISIILGKLTTSDNNLKLVRRYYILSNIALLIAPVVFSQILLEQGSPVLKFLGAYSFIISFIYVYIFRNIISLYNKNLVIGLFIIIFLVLGVYYLLNFPDYLRYLFGIAAITMVSQIIVMFAGKNFEHSKKLRDFINLILVGMIFFFAFSQQYFFMPLFIEKYLNLYIFSYRIPTPLFAIINPLAGILISPLINKFFNKPAQMHLKSIVLLCPALGFLALALGIKSPQYIGPYIIFLYIFFAVGEIFLVPTILSKISMWKYQSEKIKLMGFLYFSMAFSKICAPQITEYLGFINENNYRIIEIFYFKKFLIISLFYLVVAAFFNLYVYKCYKKNLL